MADETLPPGAYEVANEAFNETAGTGTDPLVAALLAAAPLIRTAAQEQAEAAEAKLADLQARWDTCWRALWIMVRQFGGSVFLTAKNLDGVPALASLGYGREPDGLRINAEEEP